MGTRMHCLRLLKSIAVLTVTLYSCNSNDSEKSQPKSKSTKAFNKLQNINSSDASIPETDMSIDTFSSFPNEIDGCSCYFSNDSTEFQKGIYIYVNDYADISFLKIDSVLTKFRRIEFRQINETTTISKSVNDNYELIIEVKNEVQTGIESNLTFGRITLTHNKTKKTITKTFYGECGC
jgi:hypothetical protein